MNKVLIRKYILEQREMLSEENKCALLQSVIDQMNQFDFSKRGKNINNIHELGQIFAKACNGEYQEQRQNIETIIQSADENHVIVIFSAGSIDYNVRSMFEKSQSLL